LQVIFIKNFACYHIPLVISQNELFNTNIQSVEPLFTPSMLRSELPLSVKASEFIYQSREKVRQILRFQDKKLLAIVGPCSIHDLKSAIDYAERLSKLSQEIQDVIMLVMRVYFEKPRTVIGWKGLINDPHLDDSFDIQYGLRVARKLLIDINEMGLPCATEVLDPVIPQYISDLISWAAIGARTTESQTHRQMTSGLSMPVGFKNGTTGDLLVAVNAIESSFYPQSFLGINQEEGKVCVFGTKGNKDAHLVLRGGTNGPNYSKEHITRAERELEVAGIETGIMVDCNHANSGKDPYKQPEILENILKQKLDGNQSIIGFMIESNIEGGSQKIPKNLSELKYGVSITDKCIDWDSTEKILRKLAEQLRSLNPAFKS
jgi:3-deoxy-7-phosphoheptulonate synthase